VTSEALVRMSRKSDGRAALARVRQVRLSEGARASVQLSRGELQVTVAAAQGLAGRPSSDRIAFSAATER